MPKIRTDQVKDLTASATELNILDGATLSTTELNYVDGVTSDIQTQINAKAPTASPTFTGTVTLPKTTEINDTTGDHQYVLAVSELSADRTVTLPLLTGADEFVFKDHTQALTNKTLTSTTNNVTAKSLHSATTVVDVSAATAPSSGQVLTATSSTTATWQTPNTISLTAGEDLTAGQLVGISNTIDSTIARAFRTTMTAASGITTPLLAEELTNNSLYAPIGGNKFVLLNYTAATSDTLFAQVVSVNTTTMSITAGTANAVATGFTPEGTGLRNACVAKLDTDKFIVFYLADASATNIQYRIGTVSGTTISWGTAATAVAAASTVATSIGFSADQIATDKGVFVFKAATTTSSRAIAFTVSGTVATFGTAVTLGTNTTANVATVVKKIATDKFVIVSGATTTLYAQVGTISGTTITMGTEALVITTTTSAASVSVVSPTTDVFIASSQTGTNSRALVACTVSGTTITAGTAIVFSTPIGLGGGVYATSSTDIYLCTSIASGTVRLLYYYTRSGTTLTLVNQMISQAYAHYAGGVLYSDNGYPLVVQQTTAANINVWTLGLSNNIIGTVQSTVSKGASVNVILSGVVNSSQSGLIAGYRYAPTAGTGTLAATNSNTAAVGDGVALSATQIML